MKRTTTTLMLGILLMLPLLPVSVAIPHAAPEVPVHDRDATPLTATPAATATTTTATTTTAPTGPPPVHPEAIRLLYDGFRPSSSPLWEPLALDGDDEASGFVVTCTQPENATEQVSEQQSQLIVYGCPIRVYDRDYGFGSPVLSVDPVDPDRVLVAALHGRPDANGTERARGGETHTVFRSLDDGLHWTDGNIDPNYLSRDHVGEESAIVHDELGRGHFAMLFRTTLDSRDDKVGLFTTPVNDSYATKVAYPFGHNMGPRLGGSLDDIDMVTLPAVPYAPNNTTDPEPTRTALALWRESHDTPHNTTGHAEWVDGAYALWPYSHDETPETYQLFNPLPGPDGEAWTRLPLNLTIGPCASSDAAVWDGKALVACRAPQDDDAEQDVPAPTENGTDDRTNGTDENNTNEQAMLKDMTDRGPVTIWALDPIAGTKEKLSEVEMVPGHIRLSVSANGLAALTSTRLFGPYEPQVDATLGWYGQTWDRVDAVGGVLHRLTGSQEVGDVAVTALVASVGQPLAFLVYHQRTAGTTDPDADVGTEPGVYAEYSKIVATLDRCGITQASRIQLGTAVDPVNARHYVQNPGIFNDIDDGLHHVRTQSGSERIRFAINDYGALQYGELITQSAQVNCPYFPLVPTTAVSPVPEPVTQASNAQNVVGAALGAFSMLMAGYLLTAKRRSRHTSTHDA